MEQDNNLATFSRVIDEGFNRGNLDALDDLVAPDLVEHQSGIRPGRDGLKAAIAALRTAFPDLHLVIEDSASGGDRTWIRMRGTGTHQGPFMGLPATGRPIEITVIDVCRFEGDRLVEHWGVADRFAVGQQLGLVPDRRG